MLRAVWLLDYNISVAVWVGIIVLAGVVMFVYLDEYFDRYQREGRMKSLEHLKEAVTGGAVQRVGPKMMTAGTTILGLLPIMWSAGTGADVMNRSAAPMVGELVTSTNLTLVVIPAFYLLWREMQWWRE